MGPLPNGLSMVILPTYKSWDPPTSGYISLNSKTTPQNSVENSQKIQYTIVTRYLPFSLGEFLCAEKNVAPNLGLTSQPPPNIWFHTLAFDGICSVCDLPLVGNFGRNRACRVVVVSPTLENKRNGILVHPKSW